MLCCDRENGIQYVAIQEIYVTLGKCNLKVRSKFKCKRLNNIYINKMEMQTFSIVLQTTTKNALMKKKVIPFALKAKKLTT